VSHKFNATIQHRDDVSYVKLAGVIDEDNELANIVERIPRGTAVIDLGEIERINSCGVRDWVNWLSRLEAQGTRAILVECSPAIVAQINLVNNFTGTGVVKSFFVPYFCPECDEEKVLLVETSDMGPPPHEPPMCRCDECDLVMDFDDMPDSYFAFLSNSRKYAEAEKVSGAIRDMGGPSEPSDKARVRSRVSSPAIAPSPKGAPPGLPGRPSAPNRLSAPPSYGAPGAAGARPGLPSFPPRGPSNLGGPNPMSNGGGLGPLPPSGPMSSAPATAGMAPLGMGMGPLQGAAPARRGNATIYTLVGVLVVAIGVLGYLLLTR
jgi:anti-anti-sigma regulatory factor